MKRLAIWTALGWIAIAYGHVLLELAEAMGWAP